MPNCLEGGCGRCAKGREEGSGYDVCSCVHAEANTLATAARFGIPLEGATVYSTLQPCFSCAKELIQARIQKVYFVDPWIPKEEWQVVDYLRLQEKLGAEQHMPDASELCPACSRAPGQGTDPAAASVPEAAA